MIVQRKSNGLGGLVADLVDRRDLILTGDPVGVHIGVYLGHNYHDITEFKSTRGLHLFINRHKDAELYIFDIEGRSHSVQAHEYRDHQFRDTQGVLLVDVRQNSYYESDVVTLVIQLV